MLKLLIKKFQLTIEEPQCIMIFSNAGDKKQDVLGILNGKVKGVEGQYFLKGKDVSTFSQREMAHLRKKEVINFSDTNFLMEGYTVEKNLQLQLKTSGIYPTKGKRMIGATLDLLDLKDFRDLPITQLSLLQKLLVRLAKAAVVEPKIICGQDPFVDLNEKEIKIVKGWIENLTAKGIIVIMITENLNHLKYGDQEIIL
ncbi:putative ABC transport system ATP-binding protein [Alkaliphilus hydrothermalis]|uniref:ABC transport system ATP-binding protein n=1 Tax=Alkaliphilus hydrothermalis TaxID=1482730 RepID=A0ABS2NRM1_9FIRM|nr:putative ABC transport system ATP-binding protein [Alkaliphilus hydrothermalis]